MTPEKNGQSERSVSTPRRRFLQGIGATGIAGVLAGCLGGDDEEEANGDDENGDDGNGDDENGGESEPATFEVTELVPDELGVLRGTAIEIGATIENTGEEDGEQDVEFLFDDDAEEVREVSLGGGESEDLEFEEIDTEPLNLGDYSYGVSTDDDEATGTLTVESAFGNEPDGLLSFEEDVLSFTDGTNVAAGSLENDYAVPLESVAVLIEVPDGWEVTGEEGTSVDTLGADESRDVEWEIDVPADAEGEFELDFEVSYESGEEDATVAVTQAVSILSPMSAPFGMDCGGSHTDETVEIDGLEFLPDPETAQAIDMDPPEENNRTLADEESWWPDTVVPDPNPNANAESWNDEWDPFPEIDDTDHDTLYQTEHWANGELSYSFLIENGTYDVTLHFAEIVQTGAEGRIFSAFVNDDPVVEDLDLYDEHGPTTAVTYTETVEVDDNQLVVDLESSVENPKISGIEIREAE